MEYLSLKQKKIVELKKQQEELKRNLLGKNNLNISTKSSVIENTIEMARKKIKLKQFKEQQKYKTIKQQKISGLKNLQKDLKKSPKIISVKTFY